ncbi:MAG TPA: hypothetical protein VFV67_10020 [Actinophytocola sp.]|uniref:DUF7455 domain-containing protein n=1 Tax=Actinophytocola sp. TaxID=1872138 RepID=UPI002DBE1485|nr:hypothetical protein [Actinophytocola sp.]HEU5470977.1 hypothetical protein [Actinophytocola sp.]
MTTVTVQHTLGLFTATDRCDRCCARAQVRVGLFEGQLQFCDHHVRQHWAALAGAALWFEHNGPV